jgi:Rrf2 family protein
MISKKAKYALKALKMLAENFDSKKPSLIAEIATQENIPKKFLESILLEMRNNGFLHSQKGRGGGYQLRVPPEDITLAKVIRVIDGPIAPLPCVSLYFYGKCDDCISEEECSVRTVMEKIRDANLGVYEHTTVRDLIRTKLP